jgi:5'(3')-deoxyribonucleotidase
MKRIFLDMDGVLGDFDGYMKKHGMTGDDAKKHPGAYLAMEPMPGAIKAVRELAAAGFEVWIATKPPTGVAFAYADKAQWVLNHLPEMERRIIITHDKGLLGDIGDILVDDRPHRANCLYFPGALIQYGSNACNTWIGGLDEAIINFKHPSVISMRWARPHNY